MRERVHLIVMIFLVMEERNGSIICCKSTLSSALGGSCFIVSYLMLVRLISVHNRSQLSLFCLSSSVVDTKKKQKETRKFLVTLLNYQIVTLCANAVDLYLDHVCHLGNILYHQLVIILQFHRSPVI